MFLDQPEDIPISLIFAKWCDEVLETGTKNKRKREVQAMVTAIKTKLGGEPDLNYFASFKRFSIVYGTDKLLFVSSNDYLKNGSR